MRFVFVENILFFVSNGLNAIEKCEQDGEKVNKLAIINASSVKNHSK